MKDKLIAGLLAIFLGSLGLHQFYLGRIGSGVLFLVATFILGWTFIPFIVSVIQGIVYLSSSNPDFQMKYVAQKKFL